jgi:hypothetical protein
VRLTISWIGRAAAFWRNFSGALTKKVVDDWLKIWERHVKLNFEMNLVDHEASCMQEWMLVINRRMLIITNKMWKINECWLLHFLNSLIGGMSSLMNSLVAFQALDTPSSYFSKNKHECNTNLNVTLKKLCSNNIYII